MFHINITLFLYALVCISGIASANTYKSIQKNMRSCFDFPFDIEAPPKSSKAKLSVSMMKEKFGCYWFRYRSGGEEVVGFYIKKRRYLYKNAPIIVLNRGGNANTVFPLKYFLGRSKPLVENGYVVIGSLYRGAKISQKSNENEMKDEFGGKDVGDILELFPIIDSIPYVDSDRIGMYGISRGAMMSYLVAKESKRVRALVTIGGPTNLFKAVEHRPEMERKVLSKWIPKYKENKIERLFQRSAQFWPERLSAGMPILLLHGSKDLRVSVNQSKKMAEILSMNNRPHRLSIIPGGGHGLTKQPYRKLAEKEMLDWFNKFLAESE